MKSIVVSGFVFLTCMQSLAQVPIINTVTPVTTYPQNKILIIGSGFSTNPAQLLVWFDQVKGTITSSSELSIEVIVPPQARLATIEVINLATGLSAKSLNKFVPFYNGTNFLITEFATPISIPTGIEESFDVCTCDLDGDGKPDLVSTKNSGTSTNITILRNTSTPGVMSFVASTVSLTLPSVNLTCGDLNMDGKPDLVIARGGVTKNQIFVLKNTSAIGAISFATRADFFIDALQSAFRVVIRDLNLDGKPEVIVSNSANNASGNVIYIFSNQSSGGTLTLNATPTKVVVTGASTTYGLDAQDMDGDTKPEIIVTQFNASDIFILKNESSIGQLSFPVVTKVPLVGNLNQLTTGDFNEDGKLDIAATSSANDNKAFVLLNQSTSTSIAFSTLPTLTGGDWPFGIDVSDIDGDQDADIIIGNINNNNTTNEIVIFRNNGNNAALAFTRESMQTGKKSRNLKVGDLDGDGKPDIAYTTVTSNSLDILRNKNCFTPVLTNIAPLTICAGQTITLTSISSPGATFAWKESGNPAFKTSIDAFADITATGSYTVTATSLDGCNVQSAALVVASGLGVVPIDPVINPVATVCSGQTILLTTPTIAGASYQWTGPNSFTSSLQNPTVPSATIANAGIYTLQLSNGTCKSNIASSIVDIANLANFSISSSVASNTVCIGSSLDLIVNTAVGHTYQWIKNGADVSGQTAGTFTINQDGVYKVRVTNTSLGCSVETPSSTVNILTVPISAFIASANTICINQNVNFTNQSVVDSRGTVVFAWDFGDATTSALQNPSKTFSTAATRSVQLTVSYTGVAGCTNATSKTIVVAAPLVPAISATVNPVCSGEPSVLSVAGTFTAYNWTGPVTGSSSTLSIDKPGTYIVNTIEANGCIGMAQIVIGNKPLLTLTVTSEGKPIALGGDVRVTEGTSVQLVASGADSFSWAPPDGLDNAAISNPKATPLVEATYTVTGSKSGSCNGTHSFTIKIDPAEKAFLPPNAFSPNGDTNNDLWVIAGVQNYTECTLSIFNKQGSKVFEQKGYTNNWDGTFEGKELPQGTYYYVLTCPNDKPITGHVLIAR